MYDRIDCANEARVMLTNVRVVVLPHWLLSTLEAYGKPLSAAINVSELLDILLVDDVAKYMYLNNRLLNSDNALMKAVSSTFNPSFMSYYSGFISSLLDSDLGSQLVDKIRILPELMKTNTNAMLTEELGRLNSEIDSSFLKEWKLWEIAGLFDNVSNKTTLDQYKASRGFELVYIDEHHMGLKLIVGNANMNPDTLLLKNLDNCMGVLNQYYDFTDVSRTALFDLFMQYTSKQTLSI